LFFVLVFVFLFVEGGVLTGRNPALLDITKDIILYFSEKASRKTEKIEKTFF